MFTQTRLAFPKRAFVVFAGRDARDAPHLSIRRSLKISDAWSVVATSFKETVADDDDSEVAGNATTVAKTSFSERLLRDILDLQPDQQIIQPARFAITEVVNLVGFGLLLPHVVKRNLKIRPFFQIIIG